MGPQVKIVYTLLAAFTVLVAWEHAARIYTVESRPSQWLDQIYEFLAKQWKLVGRFIAWASSFYYHLKLEQLAESAGAILKPMIQIVFSPLWIVKGYAAKAAEYEYSGTILIGTATLTVIVAYAYLVYGFKYRHVEKVEKNE